MMIRGLWPCDILPLIEIHQKHYKEEFDFPEFYKNFLCSFTVIEDDKIIASGGIRTIAEAVLITDKDLPLWQRGEALVEILNASKFICTKFMYDQLHAFIQDENWLKVLEKYGFRRTRGQSLVTEVSNGKR